MVKASIEAKIRPLSNPSLEKASLQGAARLYVSKDSLISLTGRLDNDVACFVERHGESALRREAVLWVLQDKNVSPNVVLMSRAFQDASGFKIGDQVRLLLARGENGKTADAGEVLLSDVSEAAHEALAGCKYPLQWEPLISLALGPFPSRLSLYPYLALSL